MADNIQISIGASFRAGTSEKLKKELDVMSKTLTVDAKIKHLTAMRNQKRREFDKSYDEAVAYNNKINKLKESQINQEKATWHSLQAQKKKEFNQSYDEAVAINSKLDNVRKGERQDLANHITAMREQKRS